MFIYRNSPCVVIGRNQNPWLESNLEYMRDHDIHLVRRYSGGGTVFHDLGNTNYSFISSRDSFSRVYAAGRIVDALTKLGLNVRVNERHDIQIAKRNEWLKSSGSAFKIAKDRAYAHGTMLLQSDLVSLGRVLKPQAEYLEHGHGIIQANGVSSVPSKVGRLDISHKQFCSAIADEFTELGRPHHVSEEEMKTEDVVASSAELQTDRWTYEQTPAFLQRNRVMGQSGTQIDATIRGGKYHAFKLEQAEQPPSVDTWDNKGCHPVQSVIEVMRNELLGKPFKLDWVQNVIQKAKKDGL